MPVNIACVADNPELVFHITAYNSQVQIQSLYSTSLLTTVSYWSRACSPHYCTTVKYRLKASISHHFFKQSGTDPELVFHITAYNSQVQLQSSYSTSLLAFYIAVYVQTTKYRSRACILHFCLCTTVTYISRVRIPQHCLQHSGRLRFLNI